MSDEAQSVSAASAETEDAATLRGDRSIQTIPREMCGIPNESGQNERHTKNASLATFVGQACECPTRKQVLGSAREAAALVAKWMPENSIMCKALVLRILGDIQNDASAPCPCEGLRAELEDAQRLRDKYLGALAASREREQKLREALESAARGMADGSLEDIREFGVRAALAALTEKQ